MKRLNEFWALQTERAGNTFYVKYLEQRNDNWKEYGYVSFTPFVSAPCNTLLEICIQFGIAGFCMEHVNVQELAKNKKPKTISVYLGGHLLDVYVTATREDAKTTVTNIYFVPVNRDLQEWTLKITLHADGKGHYFFCEEWR